MGDALVETEDGAMLCPGCGYDLRGTVGDRCSECGLDVDRAAMGMSGVPWAHRRKIGWVRAYVRTVWAVAADWQGAVVELGRPQVLADGRSFRWVTTAIVAATLLGAWGWVVWAQDGLAFLGFRPVSVSNWGRPMPWWMDLVVPWSAGAMMPWVVPVCLVMLAAYVTGVQQAVFRVGAKGEAYQRRVGVIALYTAGPLIMLLPALACFAMVAVVDRRLKLGPAALAIGMTGVVLLVAALVGTPLRVGRWVRRAGHRGALAVALAAAELMALWLLGVVLCLGLIPWGVGFVWIVIDSLR